MVSQPSTLEVSSFGGVLSTFQLVGLGKEFEPILDHLWKTSFDYIDFGLKRKNDFKDWRKTLQGHKIRFNYLVESVAEQVLRG